MNISSEVFGYIGKTPVRRYTLTNGKGTSVKIMNYGATITSFSITDGVLQKEIVAGFDNLESYFSELYLSNGAYFGSTIGRFANRIDRGVFEINGELIYLDRNLGSHHIHGGYEGFDKKIWSCEDTMVGNSPAVVMRLFSPHLDQGYPGNVNVEVKFILTETNELCISYTATTDKITPLSLTNHSYFNLSGFQNDIQDHLAIIHASQVLKTSKDGIPDGDFIQVQGTKYDYQKWRTLNLGPDGSNRGIDRYFIFDKPSGKMAKVAEFRDQESNCGLEVWTDEPGMQLYTANHISPNLSRKNGNQYGPFCGFCCETHRFPNSPNIKNAPGAFLLPEDVFTSKTKFILKN